MTTRKNGYEALRIIPCIRSAVRVGITPSPTIPKATSIARAVIHSWLNVEKSYRSFLTEQTNKKLIESPKGITKYHLNGNTVVVDFPEYIYNTNNRDYALRFCIAICTAESSSKFLCRVTLPRIQLQMSTLSKRQLHNSIADIRRLASDSASWLYSNLKADFESAGYAINRKPSGLEVIAIGSKDEALRDVFGRLGETSLMAEELFSDSQKMERLFYSYYSAATDLPGTLLDITSGKSDAIWFSSLSSVVLPGGICVPREVLYMMRSKNSTAEVIGLGYDDSETGELAINSSLSVLEWIGAKV